MGKTPCLNQAAIGRSISDPIMETLLYSNECDFVTKSALLKVKRKV